jgi:AraC-like DNA-binding protein
MQSQPDTFSRYLPVETRAKKWGWHLKDAGRQHIAPGAPYPGTGHPLGYLFGSDGKRILDEYQVVLIATGGGTFESGSQPRRNIRAGDALILFPGEWHRYKPDPETGWTEYWAGFKGTEAERIMASFFSPESPVQRGSMGAELIRQFDRLIQWLKKSIPERELILASHIPLILSFLIAGRHQSTSSDDADARLVRSAKAHMLENLSHKTDLEELAKSLGTSYSRLRSVFKKQTGFAPRQFENMVKMNRSKDLLLSGNYNISKTAEALGYSSVFYFSRAFRKAFGRSPKDWVRLHKQ